jgi:hypothetical protein
MNLTIQTSGELVQVYVSNNTTVSACNFKVVGLPIANIVCLDSDKVCKFNKATGDVIVYGMNKLLIDNGISLEISFDIPATYGEYTIQIGNAFASTPEALPASITTGGVAIIATGFSTSEFMATVDEVVSLGDEGVDANGDDIVNICDVQFMVDKLRG